MNTEKNELRKEEANSTQKLRHTIQMPNDRPVYNLPLVNNNVHKWLRNRLISAGLEPVLSLKNNV